MSAADTMESGGWSLTCTHCRKWHEATPWPYSTPFECKACNPEKWARESGMYKAQLGDYKPDAMKAFIKHKMQKRN